MAFRGILSALASAALLTQSSAWVASAGEQWEAYSKTATAITGDVTFSPDRVTFGNGTSLPLAPAGVIADYMTVWGKRNATLFRVTAPADPVLLNGTRLCGKDAAPEPVTFLVISIPPPAIDNVQRRAMDVFSGAQAPKGVETPHFCGNYNFEPAGKRDSISTPAAAIDPAYLGFWAPSPKACRADERTAFRITPKGISSYEEQCEIKQASSDGAGWLVRLSCASEGYDSTITLHWQLAPNGRLRETMKGRTSEFVRCKESDHH